MKYQTYAKYKPSGVEWIGEIPEEWSFGRLKFIKKLQGGFAFKSDDFVESGISVIRIGDITDDIHLENCKKIDSDAKIPKEFLANMGDVLIALTGATIGKVGIIKNNNCKAYINQRVAKISSSSNYYYYLFKSDFIKKQIELIASGSAQENISNSQIEDFVVPFNDNQKKISDFLDKKTKQVDDLIEKDKKLIELLKEKRVALINRAVTRGLSENVKFKDSGVEWIGEIPEGWEVRRLKTNCFVNPINIKRKKDKELVNFLPMEKVGVNGNYDVESVATFGDVCSGFTSFINGDILFAKITPCFENGKGALVENLINEIGFGTTEFHVLRCRENMHPKFVFYFTKSDYFRKIGEAFMQGAAGQKRVSTDFTKDFLMSTPPINEQEKIAAFLDDATKRMDEIVKNIKNRILLLEEYKKSLIYNAVTGKIRV